MNVNGVSGYSQLEAYNAYANTSKTKSAEETAAAANASAVGSDVAAVYEKSENALDATSTVSPKYTQNTELVKKLLSEADSAKNQLMSYVQETLMGQGNALAASDDVWQFLASGNYTVSEAAKAEAEKAIGEGGYWSAEKTSDRIVEFAKALTGGDPSKIDAMRDAIDKGFKEATKAWGKDLPSITNDTHDLINKKLDNWANEAAGTI